MEGVVVDFFERGGREDRDRAREEGGGTSVGERGDGVALTAV